MSSDPSCGLPCQAKVIICSDNGAAMLAAICESYVAVQSKLSAAQSKTIIGHLDKIEDEARVCQEFLLKAIGYQE